MVQLTQVRLAWMNTFGRTTRGKKFNHRLPIRFQRLQSDIDPEEIVAHYSRDDIDKINPRAERRTYKDAQFTMGKKNNMLPNLSDHDLEINQIYQEELDRQRAIVARINRISVKVESNPGQGMELMMNKDISTPNDCANHVHELLGERSVVVEITPNQQDVVPMKTEHEVIDEALGVNKNNSLAHASHDERSTIFWDMHRPLTGSCSMKFRHFYEKDVYEINKIYWRSCSFVLGMAIRLAFKDDVKVLLHSWPKPNIKSGSFVYDAAINVNEKWTPTEQELRAFTKVMWDIKRQSLPFDRLLVDRDLAKKLFAYNPFKLSQIDSILQNESSLGKVSVYRCGGLLDISVGPMIANTSQIGRITLAAVHPFESTNEQMEEVFYRFQGVSLPQQLPVSSYLYQNLLIKNAQKLNKVGL